MFSRIIWFFRGNILFRNRRIEYEGEPVPYEEEFEQEQEIFEPVQTFANYYPGKQTPLDHVVPILWNVICLLKLHAMFRKH